MYVCVYVCIHACMYICTHTHTYINKYHYMAPLLLSLLMLLLLSSLSFMQTYTGQHFNRGMAKTLLDRAVQIRLSQLGDKELPTSDAMNDMAQVLLYQREVTQAKQLLDIAVGVRHSTLGIYIYIYILCTLHVVFSEPLYVTFLSFFLFVYMCDYVCIRKFRIA